MWSNIKRWFYNWIFLVLEPWWVWRWWSRAKGAKERGCYHPTEYDTKWEFQCRFHWFILNTGEIRTLPFVFYSVFKLVLPFFCFFFLILLNSSLYAIWKQTWNVGVVTYSFPILTASETQLWHQNCQAKGISVHETLICYEEEKRLWILVLKHTHKQNSLCHYIVFSPCF